MNNAAKYTKRPVTIEAVQYTRRFAWPDWFHDAVTRNDIIVFGTGKWAGPTEPCYCEIKTLEGTMRAEENDWIIRGIKGEIYPCKPDIFEASYIAELESRPAAPEKISYSMAEAVALAYQRGVDSVTPAAPVVAEGLTEREKFETWYQTLAGEGAGNKWLDPSDGEIKPLRWPAEYFNMVEKVVDNGEIIMEYEMDWIRRSWTAWEARSKLAAHPVAGSPEPMPASEAANLKKLCDQLDGMKRTMFLMPGTGQHYSYLLLEDVSAYVEEARKSLAAPAAPTDAKPIAWLRFWSACRAPGDCEDFYEVCNEGDKGIDGSPAFPVFNNPTAAQSVRDAAQPTAAPGKDQ